MTLSNCYPNQYTCDSGDCIDLAKRCDTVTDCKDKSDEVNCYYVQFSSDYAVESTPKAKTRTEMSKNRLHTLVL